MKREELLLKITEIEFAAVDLQLFLNTHPYDKAALEKYNIAVCESKALREEYMKNYGSLFNFIDPSSPECFTYLSEYWPWEKDYNADIEEKR
jgi:spore coat protein JB